MAFYAPFLNEFRFPYTLFRDGNFFYLADFKKIHSLADSFGIGAIYNYHPIFQRAKINRMKKFRDIWR
jgi:hypothetical protein